MNDQTFLEIFNAVVKLAKPFHNEAPKLTNLSINIKDSGIDSLDYLMVNVYFSDIFEIPETVLKTNTAKTLQELYNFILANSNNIPSNLEEAMAKIK